MRSIATLLRFLVYRKNGLEETSQRCENCGVKNLQFMATTVRLWNCYKNTTCWTNVIAAISSVIGSQHLTKQLKQYQEADGVLDCTLLAWYL